MCSMTGPAPIRRSDALPADYPQFLAEVKARIAGARTRAVLAVNSELIRLYWEIGHEILEREQRERWGAKVINRLAADLRREFPDMTGLSLRNLRYMRAFARAWPAESPSSIVQQPAAQLPWAHMSTRSKERDLEQALLNDVQSLLMEMGRGFALVGRQFPLRIVDEETGEEDEFFIDLLFYNYLLRRFVVIDLKVEDFKPEFTGKMSFYLTAVDELERQPGDEPSIGLVLCPGRRKTVTEWALRGIDSPVAIARYTTGEVTLTQTPPPEMKPALPDLPALASELSEIVEAAHTAHDDESTEM
jgi:predicted nuclease of restriction endonuclease-like (RecB) superfamily